MYGKPSIRISAAGAWTCGVRSRHASRFSVTLPLLEGKNHVRFQVIISQFFVFFFFVTCTRMRACTHPALTRDVFAPGVIRVVTLRLCDFYGVFYPALTRDFFAPGVIRVVTSLLYEFYEVLFFCFFLWASDGW